MYSKLLGGDLVALFSFTFLLYAENEQGIFDTILRGHIDFSSDPWPSISSSAKDLVKKMLRADPKERLAAVDVLSKFHFETSTRFGFVFIFFSFSYYSPRFISRPCLSSFHFIPYLLSSQYQKHNQIIKILSLCVNFYLCRSGHCIA